MEPNENLLDPLLERVENYSKTSVELMKLKLINKTSEVISMMIFHFLLVTVFSICLICLSIAAGIWLGSFLDSYCLGFLFVAFFYAIVCLILFFMSPVLKARIYNSVLGNILH